MKTIRIATIVLFAIVGLFLVSLVTILVLSVSLVFRKERITETLDVNVEEYKFYQFNPRTSESKFGIITSFDKLSDEEFKSSQDENGILSLTSNFGSNEYRCTGSCVCSQASRRVSTSLPFTRGLIYLVASVSLLGAHNIANSHFENECREKLEETCPYEMIESEVNSCEEVNQDSENEEFSSNEEDYGGQPRFLCKGKCMMTSDKDMTEEEKYECQKVGQNLRGTDYFKMIKLCIVKAIGCSKLRMEDVFYAPNKEFAEKRFTYEILDAYCKTEGAEKVTFKNGYIADTKMCSGFRKGKNKSVSCRKI